MEEVNLTEDLILKLKFHPNPKGVFENIEMPYYVKKGVCLFYNESSEPLKSFYAGFAEMRQSKYYAVQIKWIETFSELKEFYHALTGQDLILLYETASKENY